MVTVTDFAWHCAPEGYEWISDIPGGSPDNNVSDPILVRKSGAHLRPYFPLRQGTLLFRQFIDLEPKPQAIEIFAREYGLLSHSHQEPLSTWRTAIKSMRLAFFLAEAARSMSLDGLIEQYRYGRIPVPRTSPSTTSKAVEPVVPGSFGAFTRVLAASDNDIVRFCEEQLDRLNFGDFAGSFAAASTFVEQAVTLNVARTQTVFALNRASNEFQLRFAPQDLLAALWLQCAYTIQEGGTLRECAECGRWFRVGKARSGRGFPLAHDTSRSGGDAPVAGQSARTDRQYCSNACRTRAYRMRLFIAPHHGSTQLPIQRTTTGLRTEVREDNRGSTK